MPSCFSLHPSFLALLLLLVLGDDKADSHPAFDAQVREVEARMEKEPENGELFLLRGRLHLHHQQWDDALSDLAEAGKLGAPGNEIERVRGMLWMLRGRGNEAVQAFSAALLLAPRDVTALVGRGRALRLAGQLDKAVLDFEKAVALSGKETPVDVLIVYARTLAALDGGSRSDEAVAVLDQGMKALGKAMPLLLCAVELEVAAGKVDAALARLDDLIARSPRKETWLARRGDICVAAGRTKEGLADFAMALRLIEGRRPSRRRVPAIRELERSLKSKLEPGKSKG